MWPFNKVDGQRQKLRERLAELEAETEALAQFMSSGGKVPCSWVEDFVKAKGEMAILKCRLESMS